MMQKMIIMRGLPGSGKSTKAKELLKTLGEDAIICSADNYFINTKTGEYEWDASKLNLAHKHCYTTADQALKNGVDVIIDNTNIRIRDVKRYISLANEYSVMVDIEESGTYWAKDIDECFNNGTHNVPKEVIEHMSIQFNKCSVEFVQDDDSDNWINILESN